MPKTRRSLPMTAAENANGATLSVRLCETDVRQIFTCVKEGKTPPGDIAFNIVKTTEKKLMLSPPSFEFGDGIYVLLRSMNDSLVAVPPRLEYLVLNDEYLASLGACKWSLSGPGSKSKKKGALQQRYSYPRGRAEYSNTKGGSMWTMIDNTGSDGLEVRVFHVYRSFKRLSSSSGSSEISGGGSSDWRSANSVKKNAMIPRKSQPLKKRIKMEEDERVAYEINSMTQHTNSAVMLQEDAIDHTSYDLDTSLTSMFGGDIDNGYSFFPVPNASPSILNDSVMMPSPVPVSASSLYYQPTMYPLSYTYDTSSQNNAGVTGGPLSLLAFSNKLYQLQDCIFNDIDATPSMEEQSQKLAVVQHWAKVTAQKPLQPPNAFAPTDKEVPSSDANVPTPACTSQFPIAAVSSKEDQTTIDDNDLPRITP